MPNLIALKSPISPDEKQSIYQTYGTEVIFETVLTVVVLIFVLFYRYDNSIIVEKDTSISGIEY